MPFGYCSGNRLLRRIDCLAGRRPFRRIQTTQLLQQCSQLAFLAEIIHTDRIQCGGRVGGFDSRHRGRQELIKLLHKRHPSAGTSSASALSGLIW